MNQRDLEIWRTVRPTGRRGPGAGVGPRARVISSGTKARVMERDGFRCRRCGFGRVDGVKLVVDHVYPVASGGSREMRNLQTLCASCNAGKGARPPHGFDLRRVAEREWWLRPPPRGPFVPPADSCRFCRDQYDEPIDYTLWPADRVIEGAERGFRASYSCDRGHQWTSWWGWD